MHSAIVYAVMPDSSRVETQHLISVLHSGLQRIEKNPALKQLGDFVWQADFQSDPEVLAVLIDVLARLEVGYAILQLADAPHWMVRNPSQKRQS